jgi:xanthine phosphoribosyltransferase
MPNIYYSYDTFVDDVKKLVNETKVFEADALLAIARGGLTLAHAYAQATDNRNLFTINSILYDGEIKRTYPKLLNLPELSGYKRVLILDDIVDSGDTLEALLLHVKRRYPQIEFKFASIFYKPTASLQPDFTCKEAKEWINFFWDAQD